MNVKNIVYRGSYLIQAIDFFRGVNGSFTFATRWIHVGGMLFKLVSEKTTGVPAAASDNEWPGRVSV